MKFSAHLGIARRLFAAWLLLVVAMAGVAAVAWSALADMADAANDAGAKRAAQLVTIADIELNVTHISLQIRHLMLAKAAPERAATLADIETKRGRIEGAFQAFASRHDTAAERVTTDRIWALVQQFWRAGAGNVSLAEAGSNDRALEFLVDQTIPLHDELLSALDQEKTRQRAALDAEVQAIRDHAHGTRHLLLGLVIAATAVCLVASLCLTRLMRRRIAACCLVAQRVRDGDLTQRVVDDRRDEFSPLLATMADMQAAVARIASAAPRGATVRQAEGHANTAGQLAAGASSVVAQGGAAAGRVADTMQSISLSSRRITDIVAGNSHLAQPVAQISMASAEQAQGAGQAGVIVNGLDEATRRHAALVEEVAAAALDMQRQAAGLVRAVDAFKVASD